MEQIIQTVYNWVWSPALVAICLLAGLYFSVGTRFVQVRRFRDQLPAKLQLFHEPARGNGKNHSFYKDVGFHFH